MRERLEYEHGWYECRRCHCRRPERELEPVDGGRVCRDRDWCDRMVLWREEQETVARESKKRRRKKGE